MAKIDYEKNLVRKPVYKTGNKTVKGRQAPIATYMSNDLVPGSNLYIELGWISAIPEPNPHVGEHKHDYNQILMYIGSDPAQREDLYGEIEYYVGGQSLSFDTTSALYIPKGLRHGPIIWKRVDQPILEMTIILGADKATESWSTAKGKAQKSLPKKTDNVNYEKYLVKKPFYQPVKRTFEKVSEPVRVYVSNDLFPGINMYVDYGWIATGAELRIGEHTHHFNEIVIHAGSDAKNPEDLGAELDYYVDGKPLKIVTTSALYLPKGLKHGPLVWNRIERAPIQIPIIIGAGSFAEALPAGYQAA
jgi:hypothetical protein